MCSKKQVGVSLQHYEVWFSVIPHSQIGDLIISIFDNNYQIVDLNVSPCVFLSISISI